jgi:hypothetical protein
MVHSLFASFRTPYQLLWMFAKPKRTIKSSLFWDIRSYCPMIVDVGFGGMNRLYLQGRRVTLARNQHDTNRNPCCAYCLLYASLLLRLLNFRPWRWRRYIPPKYMSTFTELPEGRIPHIHCCENLNSNREHVLGLSGCMLYSQFPSWRTTHCLLFVKQSHGRSRRKRDCNI